MINDDLYPLAALVTIQGPRVLRLLASQNKFALFDVIGFENQIFIQDFRQNCVRAIHELEKNDDATQFPHEFNVPAYVTVKVQPDQTLLITLEDTHVKKPKFMLWIAIGLECNLPLYNYLFEYVLPFDNNTLAIVAIYQRPSTAYQLFEGVSDPASFSSSPRTARYNSSSELSELRISSGSY